MLIDTYLLAVDIRFSCRGRNMKLNSIAFTMCFGDGGSLGVAARIGNTLSEVKALVIREVQYVLLYVETERWPFPGPAGIAHIQTGPAEGGETKAPWALVPGASISCFSNIRQWS
jgi:hypothetical protein